MKYYSNPVADLVYFSTIDVVTASLLAGFGLDSVSIHGEGEDPTAADDIES